MLNFKISRPTHTFQVFIVTPLVVPVKVTMFIPTIGFRPFYYPHHTTLSAALTINTFNLFHVYFWGVSENLTSPFTHFVKQFLGPYMFEGRKTEKSTKNLKSMVNLKHVFHKFQIYLDLITFSAFDL
jgi:hypothetical protein